MGEGTAFYYPLEGSYLKEMIDDLLQIYNTVSIQKSKDCYVVRLGKCMKERDAE